MPRIHAVTDDRVLGLPDFFQRASAVVMLGPAVALHLRGRMDGGPLLALARRLRDLTARSGTALLVHDRLDVARLADADGAHLPAAGVPVAVARRDLGPDRLLGRSTHRLDEARAAREAGADYVFLGPIWATGSHPDRAPLGAGALAGAPAPVIAIGGITPERAREARMSGAYGVAAITALWHADDPAAAARAFLLSFEP